MAISSFNNGGAGAGRGDNPHGVPSGKPRPFGTTNPNAPVGVFAPNVMAFSSSTRNAPAPSKQEIADNTAQGKVSPISNSSQAGYSVSPGSMGDLRSAYKNIRQTRPDIDKDTARSMSISSVGGNMTQDAYGNATDARYTQKPIM